MTCKNHPKYKGKMRPRVDCLQCWKVWMANRSDPMQTGDLLTIIELLEREVDLAYAKADRALDTHARFGGHG